MNALRISAAVTLAAAWLILLVPGLFFAGPREQSTGIRLIWSGNPAFYPAGGRIVVSPGSAAFNAGLRTGDHIGCLSRADVERILVRADYFRPAPLSLCVRRNGSWQSVAFVPRPEVATGTRNSWPGIALRLAAFIAFLVSGIVLLAGRPGRMTAAYFAFCLGTGGLLTFRLFYVTILGGFYEPLEDIVFLSTSLASAFLLLFVLRLPDDHVEGWRAPAYRAAVIATPVFAAYSAIFLAIHGEPPVRIITISTIFTVLAAAAVIARLFSLKNEERIRFAWAAFGILFGLIAFQIDWSLGTVPPDVRFLFAGLSIAMPLALMYAILRQHLIDIRFVVSRTVLYALLTTFVVVIIGVVDWLTSVYLAQTKAALAVDAAVTIALGLVLHRTYRWFERLADSVLFRKKHEADVYLQKLGRSLLQAQREETIDRALVHDPYEKMELTCACLFRLDPGSARFMPSCTAGIDLGDVAPLDSDNDVVRFLRSEKTTLSLGQFRRTVAAQLGGGDAAVAIPVYVEETLLAFTLYGPHATGAQLDPDEVRTLEALGIAAGHAYARLEYRRYRMLYEENLRAPAP